jgi:hypothetical protein
VWDYGKLVEDGELADGMFMVVEECLYAGELPAWEGKAPGRVGRVGVAVVLGDVGMRARAAAATCAQGEG